VCAPFLERTERLPEPQQEALHTSFGLSAGRSPDRFLVGLAVLGLVAEIARERPLVCVVDDAQWLDQASAQVLAFVARRLQAESVGMVFAVRDPHEVPELVGVTELSLAGLPDEAARTLLGMTRRGPIDEQLQDRIVAETRVAVSIAAARLLVS
jgi:AAA ATPase-like protein